MKSKRLRIMNKRNLFLAATLLVALTASAQLPPVFGNDTANTRRDQMTRTYISPKRIVWKSGSVGNTAQLLSLGTGQPSGGTSPYCKLETQVKDTASVLLDYGHEMHGGLKLVTGKATSATVMMHIRLGESVGEVMSEADGGRNRTGFTSNDHATRDFILAVPRYGQIEVGSTGFRFVRIDLLPTPANGGKTELQLCEAEAIMRYRAIPYLGSFHCSDARLDSIWLTGAYTVHLNMQEYLWDGIKRDRMVWLGDMHPEVSTIMSVFGQNNVVERSLDLACQQYPLPRWLNGMSSYSLWYLIIQHDWYMHGGDMAFLQKHKAYITGLIDKIDSRVDADGTEHMVDASNGKKIGRFLDWPSSPNKAGVEAGYRALMVWAMTDAEKLCNWLGDGAKAAKCRDIKARLMKKILPDNGLKQAASLMAIAGLESAKKACNQVVSVGGAKGFSTFYGYYMLQALAMAGKYDEAINIIREFWGSMLDLGATTFWEDFNLDWMKNAARIDEITPPGKVDVHRAYGDYCYISYRHSFCHGWSSGPTAWLSQHVLGIEVVGEGCSKLRIEPHLGNLQWAEGTYPTPLGIVKVRHERAANGKITTTVDAPKGIEIVK